LIANPWISLCHSLFYVLHWHSSFLLYRFLYASSSVMFAYVSQWRHRRRTKQPAIFPEQWYVPGTSSFITHAKRYILRTHMW
jgi:hypothetical protein